MRKLVEGAFMSQTKHTEDILKKFDMVKEMPTNGHLELDIEGKR